MNARPIVFTVRVLLKDFYDDSYREIKAYRKVFALSAKEAADKITREHDYFDPKFLVMAARSY